MPSKAADKPLVSVIVPVYNGADHLGATLQSILEQDYENFEVVVIDDGSTDDSGAVAQRFPVRYRRQDNAGVSAARNAGVAVAKGELLSFCDADDRFLPGKLRKQVSALLERPELGCLLVRSAIRLDEGVDRPPWIADEEVTWEAALVWRWAFEKAGGFDTAYSFGEGLEWLGRLKDVGVEVDVLPEVLAERRIHGSNVSFDRAALQGSMLRIARERVARNTRQDRA